jgi:hypothetical protein
MLLKRAFVLTISLGIAALSGCNRATVAQANADAATSSPAAAAPAPAPTFTLQAGVSVPVRLQETLDTRRNRAGDQFTAVLDAPLVSGDQVGDQVVVPKGTLFTGHITRAVSSGRFKGRAVMGLTLDSFQLNGQTYQISSTNSARLSRGHKRRNWLWIGGSSGGGAAIGAAAAGGPGALIGAGAGAAAGTVGAAITGKQQVQVPVETRITFTLQSAVQIPG